MPITINTQALKTRESTSDPWTPAIVRANTDLQPALDITGDGVLSGFPSGVDDLTEAANANRNTLSTYVRPNLLDNWYWVYGKTINNDYSSNGTFPVNQRGQQSYTGNVYGLDRWAGSNGVVVTINSDCVSFEKTGTGTAAYQKLESGKCPTGLTYTLSVLVKELNGTCQAIWHNGTAIDLSVGLNTITFTPTQPVIYVYPVWELSGSISIKAVKLELGQSQTLCHNEGTDANPVWVLNEIPNYAEELAKCQRYFVKIPKRTYTGVINGTTSAYFFIPTPAPLVKIPSLVNVTGFTAWINGGTASGFTLDSIELSGNGIVIWLNSTVSALTNASFEVSGGTDYYLDANL